MMRTTNCACSQRRTATGFLIGLLGFSLIILSGCRSAFVNASIENQSDSPIKLVEVDYPSASFGASTIGPHSTFNYRFKIQGSGQLKIEFTDATGKLHDSVGPTLNQGQQGTLAISIQPDGSVRWQPSLASTP
jgi:hypothetical protein